MSSTVASIAPTPDRACLRESPRRRTENATASRHSHVKKRRMDRERGILQHGVQVAPVRRDLLERQSFEGMRVMSVNSRKPKLTNPTHPSRSRESCGRWRLKIATARSRRKGSMPTQPRSLVRAPECGHAIESRQGRIRIGRQVLTKNRSDEGVHECADRGVSRARTAPPRRDDHGQPARILARRTTSRTRSARRHDQREDQREMTEFGNHDRASFAPFRVACRCRLALERLRDLGGMDFSSCFARISSATKLPFCNRPCATTPCPSRNRSGRIPEYAGTVWQIRDDELDVERACGFLDAALLTMPPRRKRLSCGVLPPRICDGSRRTSRCPGTPFVPSQAARLTRYNAATMTIRLRRAFMVPSPAAARIAFGERDRSTREPHVEPAARPRRARARHTNSATAHREKFLHRSTSTHPLAVRSRRQELGAQPDEHHGG